MTLIFICIRRGVVLISNSLFTFWWVVTRNQSIEVEWQWRCWKSCCSWSPKKKKKVVLNGTEEEKKYLNNIGIGPAGSARWRIMSGIGLRFFFFLIIGLDWGWPCQIELFHVILALGYSNFGKKEIKSQSWSWNLSYLMYFFG